MKRIVVFLTLISGAFALNYHGVALAPDNIHGWAVCIDTVLIFNTTNGGATWQTQNNIPDSVKRFFDVSCIDQVSAWTCGMLGEILHTDNGGLDWYVQAIGLSKYATRIEFIDQDHGWAVCGDGTVGRTVDGGSYWDQIFTPWYSAEFYGVSFVNQWDGWVVAGFPDSMLMGQGLILKSTDGGINWDSLYQITGFEDFFDVHFFNLFDGIVVGGDETDYSPIIMKTTDGGQNWSFITAPVSAYYLRAVDFIGSEGWAVGMNGTIIHTTDGGDTWTFQTNPATNTLFDVDFSDNLHGLACGHNHLLYTTDGGQNWYDVGILEENKNSGIRTPGLTVYPNPSRGITNISFGTEQKAKSMELKIYDVSGTIVKVFNLASGFLLSASAVSWDGKDENGRRVANGIYFISCEINNKKMVKKAILIK